MSRYGHILEQVHAKALACGRNPEDITLIAVSKNYTVEQMQKAYEEGCRNFGESRLQEALTKIPQMPVDCQWHFIGTLQANKVSKSVASFQLIHSVDSPSLAQKISKASEAQGLVTPVLLQVNTSGESTKHGLSHQQWEECLKEVINLQHIQIEGLMTMAPLTDNQATIRNCFRSLSGLITRWKGQMKDPALFKHLSMGMSHDYLIAIEEGATLVRIGTAIFEK